MEFKALTRDDILMKRDKEFPLTPELEANLAVLLPRMNAFCKAYYDSTGKNATVSSGYRPGRYNAMVGGAKKSCHLFCEAVDLHDIDRGIKDFVMSDLSVLDKCDLYLEDLEKTPRWCHLDIRQRAHRVFAI